MKKERRDLNFEKSYWELIFLEFRVDNLYKYWLKIFFKQILEENIRKLMIENEG
jgi:hypothetical protein